MSALPSSLAATLPATAAPNGSFLPMPFEGTDEGIAAPAARVVTLGTIAAALGIIALVVPEIWLAAVALVWSLGSIAHLPVAPLVVFAAIVAVPTLWATWRVVRLAFEAETDPVNAL